MKERKKEMWAGFFCRLDVSISIFGRTKEFSEVRGTSLMCNFGVRSRFLDVIYDVRPPNGSPARSCCCSPIFTMEFYKGIFNVISLYITLLITWSIPTDSKHSVIKGQHSIFTMYLSRDMRFPTMWYVRPAKAQTSLHTLSLIRAFASHLSII